MHINEKRHDIEELQQQQMKLTAQWNEANSTVHLLKSSITELEHEICTGKKIGHHLSRHQSESSALRVIHNKDASDADGICIDKLPMPRLMSENHEVSELLDHSLDMIVQLMTENQELRSDLNRMQCNQQSHAQSDQSTYESTSHSTSTYDIDIDDSNEALSLLLRSSYTSTSSASASAFASASAASSLPLPLSSSSSSSSSSTSTSTCTSSVLPSSTHRHQHQHLDRRMRHRMSDAKRYIALKSAVAELDAVIHDEESSLRLRNEKALAHNVLHEAVGVIERLRHEKETLTKKIQELHDNDNDINDASYDIANANSNKTKYNSNNNSFMERGHGLSHFTSDSGSRSLSCSLTLLEPSMSAFGIVMIKVSFDGIRIDVTENIAEYSGWSRQDVIGTNGDEGAVKFTRTSPAEELKSFKYYVKKGLAPVLTAEEFDFNSQGGEYEAKVNPLISMLMLRPSRAIRHIGRFMSRNGTLIESVFSVTLMLTSGEQPDCFLSMIHPHTVRVISISSSLKQVRVH
jgi:hypothetical protein